MQTRGPWDTGRATRLAIPRRPEGQRFSRRNMMKQGSTTAADLLSDNLFGSLSDLRILDLTQMLAGPFATMILADQGATVIKIEPPEGGMSRGAGLYRGEGTGGAPGGYFQSINRNKDSVVLDLK